MVLYEHPQAEVRMMAAYMTLAIAYQSAGGVLQLIVDRKEFPQALTAACHWTVSIEAHTSQLRGRFENLLER